MPSERVLSGVAHDIAHHVAGPYVHIYPVLQRLCKAAGVRKVVIDLLSDSPYPTAIPFDPSIANDVALIRDRLWAILEGYQLAPKDVSSVRLEVGLGGTLLSAAPSRKVHATITSSKGKVYEATAGDLTDA